MFSLDGLVRDIRFGLRQLAANPVFAMVAILSLGVAIGANTSIFSLLNAVALRRLPVPHPERLVEIDAPDSQNRPVALSYAQVSALRARQSVFSSISGWLLPVLNVEVNGSLSRGAVLVVTGDYYSTYSVSPILGRTLLPSDTRSASGGAAAVAVISFQCWQARFGRDAAILGKTIRIEGRPFTIVGVMPAHFSSPQIDVSADATIPVEASPLAIFEGPRGLDPKSLLLLASARLRDGVSLRQANAQMRVLWPSILRDTEPAGLSPAQAAEFFARRIQLEPGARGQSFLRNRFWEPLEILMAAVATLLLLACVNLATLLLARASSRAGEMGVRLALGAKRGRLMRQLFTESLLLAVASTAAGVLLAFWSGPLLLTLMWASPIELTISLRPDVRILAFTAGLAFLAAILFGLAPGWTTIQESLHASLRESARSIAGARGSWLRRSLVAGQIALAVMLLSSAGLLMRTAQKLRGTDLGFQPEHVAVFFLSPKPGGYAGVNMDAYARELLSQVASVPGVTSAALSNWMPVYDNNSIERVSTGSALLKAHLQVVSYDFFKTLGASIVSGREFSRRDTAGSPRVVIVSQALAQRLFPAGDALGRPLSVGDDPARQNLQIVGIAHDARFGGLHRYDPLAVYLPLFQNPKLLEYAVFEVRSGGRPVSVIPSVNARIPTLGREFTFFSETLAAAIDVNLAEERMLASLSTFFGAAALLLAWIGLYGLQSYAVNRRTREFGVRLALGAGSRRVFRSVLKEALGLLAAGIAAGIPLALAAGRILASRLPNLAASDPAPLAMAAGALAVAGLLAASVPALRAGRVDPVEALRAE
jgi:predicted permease